MKRFLFHKLYVSRVQAIQTLLAAKSMNYGSSTDVFENNKRAAEIAGKQPEDFLMIQVTKHVAALCMRAAALTSDDDKLTEEDIKLWRENMDDVSLWMFLLNGLLEERFQKGVAESEV